MLAPFTPPVLSVITVNFNESEKLAKTIQSVCSQTYTQIHYVVIDGGSSDGSVDVLRENGKSIDYWVSEKDKGLYDAMNKGVLASKGEWIIFMNCGDFFASNDVVEKIFSKDRTNSKVIYGHHYIRYRNLRKDIYVNEAVELLWRGMIFSHQSMFTRRELLIERPFEFEKYPTAADYNLIFTLSRRYSFQKADLFISSVEPGGVSDKKRISSVLQQYEVLKALNELDFKKRLYYLFLLFDTTLKIALIKIMPQSVFMFLLKRKK